MGDIVLFYFFQNMFIFCCIFWLLTWVGEYFYKKKDQFSKKQFYECGFRNITEIHVQTNFNYIIFAVFLVLYDVEFMFLVPLIFNFSCIALLQLSALIIFMVFFLFSLYYDWQMKALN
jgi:NADH:ubiquinone oxidoreductase subunit 3 (subunit A)